MDLYDYPDIYDERFTEGANKAYREHYKKMFSGCDITDILDCSIGTGCLTFCLCELGYQVYGSDLSSSMLKKAEEKALEKGFSIPLTQCDFRELSKNFNRKFSLVMSSGNAFAHVANSDVVKTIKEMDKLVAPGGYFYFDSRNWEKELKNKQRFQFARPFIKEDGTRINYVQVWDYHADESITINILNAYEKDGQIIRQDVFEEHLNPFKLDLVTSTLKELGYGEINVKPCPYFSDAEFEDIGWYCVLAKKTESGC